MSSDNITKTFKLYILTLQSSKILFSSRLSDALGKLKSQPLVMDKDIRHMEDLDFDVFKPWIADDIRNFTPWIRLNEMTKSEVEKTIKRWSKEAFMTFTEGSKTNLKTQADFSEVITIRKKAFDIWLAAAPVTPTHSSIEIFEGLRDIFNGQLSIMLRSQAKRIESVGEKISCTVKKQTEDDNTKRLPSLWAAGLISADYSDGAEIFKKELQDRLLGHDTRIAAILYDYKSWLGMVKLSQSLIEDLSHSRWEDTLDEDIDGTEDPDIDWTGTLNEDDPHLLGKEQCSAVTEALKSLEKVFGQFTKEGGSNKREEAAFLLRLIRDIKNDLPVEVTPDQGFDFAKNIIPPLQETLVSDIINQVLPVRIVPRAKARNARVPGRTLWDGDPALPSQSLPTTFRFLRRLSESMELSGVDLWNPSTLKILKEQLAISLSKSIASEFEQFQTIKGSSTTPTADSKKSEEAESCQPENETADKANISVTQIREQDWQIQLIFDTLYLRAALSTQKKSIHPLYAAAAQASSEIPSDGQIFIALETAAMEYWKHTNLLFGLLNADSRK